MTKILWIVNWGEWQTVMLTCGHQRRVRQAQVTTEQLYIGKRVECVECAKTGAQ